MKLIASKKGEMTSSKTTVVHSFINIEGGSKQSNRKEVLYNSETTQNFILKFIELFQQSFTHIFVKFRSLRYTKL